MLDIHFYLGSLFSQQCFRGSFRLLCTLQTTSSGNRYNNSMHYRRSDLDKICCDPYIKRWDNQLTLHHVPLDSLCCVYFKQVLGNDGNGTVWFICYFLLFSCFFLHYDHPITFLEASAWFLILTYTPLLGKLGSRKLANHLALKILVYRIENKTDKNLSFIKQISCYNWLSFFKYKDMEITLNKIYKPPL